MQCKLGKVDTLKNQIFYAIYFSSNSYSFLNVLVRDDDDVGGIPYGSAGPTNVGEHNLSNQDISRVKIKHLTESTKNNNNQQCTTLY